MAAPGGAPPLAKDPRCWLRRWGSLCTQHMFPWKLCFAESSGNCCLGGAAASHTRSAVWFPGMVSPARAEGARQREGGWLRAGRAWWASEVDVQTRGSEEGGGHDPGAEVVGMPGAQGQARRGSILRPPSMGPWGWGRAGQGAAALEPGPRGCRGFLLAALGPGPSQGGSCPP